MVVTALECHTDDTTCCRGIDNPPNGTGRGEWYYPDGTVVPPVFFVVIDIVYTIPMYVCVLMCIVHPQS